jgi:hypothetical protein
VHRSSDWFSFLSARATGSTGASDGASAARWTGPHSACPDRGPQRLPSHRLLAWLRPLADWALVYERMVLEGSGSPAQHERALHLFSRVIVPLVGHVRLCELAGEHAWRLATGVVPSLRKRGLTVDVRNESLWPPRNAGRKRSRAPGICDSTPRRAQNARRPLGLEHDRQTRALCLELLGQMKLRGHRSSLAWARTADARASEDCPLAT